MTFLNRIAALLFPRRCLICGKSVDVKPLCGSCEGKKVHSRRVFDIDGVSFCCYAPLEYGGEFRKSFHKFKFEGKYSLGIQMAELMAEEIEGFNADIIAFVPMTREKKRRRGYNQSELLAKNIAKLTGIPCEEALTKKSENQTQSTLGANERKQNVKGVFTIEKNVAGKRVLLIDDLITTGATICECAKLIMLAGADEVRGICAASAERGEHSA